MARRSYHHGDLAAALVAEGLAIVAAKGYEALTLRAAARRARVSAASVYRHFADKDALLAEIAARGFEQLNAAFALSRSDARRRAPLARLRALGIAYVEFALAQPGLYRLMFGARHPGQGRHAGLDDQAGRAYAALGDSVAACCPPGTDRATMAAATVAAWSLVHGYVILRLEGQLAAFPPGELPDISAVLNHYVPRAA